MKRRKNGKIPSLFNPKAAGRSPIPFHKRTYVPHRARLEIPKGKPVHVVWRLNPHVPPCRRKNILQIFKLSVLKARKTGLKVIHFSLMNDHLHLLLEAENKNHMAKTLQSFAISFTKRLKYFHRLKRTPIFKERYFVHILRSVQEAKNAISYILNNGQKAKLTRNDIDPYSSAMAYGLVPPNGGIWWHEIISMPKFWILRQIFT